MDVVVDWGTNIFLSRAALIIAGKKTLPAVELGVGLEVHMH